MFCEKCGTQIEDNALFCTNCGEKISNDGLPMQPEVKGKTKLLPIAVIAGLVLIVVLVVSLAGGSRYNGINGYQKTVDNYFKAYETKDANLMHSSVIAQYWIDYADSWGANEAFEAFQRNIESDIKAWGCGSDIKITYKIVNERRATKEELEELESEIYAEYARYVYERGEFAITDAYAVDIDFTVTGDKGTGSFRHPELLIVQENGNWRIHRGSISSSFYDNR